MGEDKEFKEKQAITWIWRLDRGLSVQEQTEFLDWLNSDPDNSKLVYEYQELWHQMDFLQKNPGWYDSSLHHGKFANTKSSKIKRLFMMASAAAVIGLSMASYFVYNSFTTDSVKEVVLEGTQGQDNERILPDGSIVHLNDRSEITVNYSQTQRKILLTKGEAFFVVKKGVMSFS